MKFKSAVLVAGEGQRLDVTGSYFLLVTATARVKVTFFYKDGSTATEEWMAGFGENREKSFTYLIVESETGQAIEVATARGKIDDNRSDISGLLSVLGVPDSGIDGEEIVGVAATEIVAANANNRQVTIKAEDGDIYLGLNNAVTASSHLLVPQGASFTFENYAGAVYGIVAAGTVSVSYIVTRVQ